MDRVVLRELDYAEQALQSTIAVRLRNAIEEGSLNLFDALYPHICQGMVSLFRLTNSNSKLTRFILDVSDLTIIPILPKIPFNIINKNELGIASLIDLWDKGKVLPVLTHPYETYWNIRELDPLLEGRPPCGAYRSYTLLKVLAGDTYERIRSAEHRFMRYMQADHLRRTHAWSILTELRVLGYEEFAQLAKSQIMASFNAGYRFANITAEILTIPIVTGFGCISQCYSIDPVVRNVLPWGEERIHEIAQTLFSKQVELKSVDYDRLRKCFMELDQACKKGKINTLRSSISELDRVFENEGEYRMSVYLAKAPRGLKWYFFPIISWENVSEPTEIVEPLIIKEIRAGDQVYSPSLQRWGTLGAFVVDNLGLLRYLTAPHVSGGQPIFLGDPNEQKEMVTYNLRIRGLDEDLPAVLKQPIPPSEGMEVISIGHGRQGKLIIREGEVLIEKMSEDCKFTIGSSTYSIEGDYLFVANLGAESGESGALVLSKNGRFPVGLVEASDMHNSCKTYCLRLTELCKENNIRGIFTPLAVPPNSSKIFRKIAASLVPDGVFMQKVDILKKDEATILKELGAAILEKDIPTDIEQYYEETPKDVDHKVDVGEKCFLAGRLLLDSQRELIGVVFASSEDIIVSIYIDRLMKGFCLELI
ncbi:MAG: hypothetical protein QXP38_12520 [Nitrososphaerota archaeon]